MDCGFISENCRGSLAKRIAELVRADLIRWIMISRSRSNRYAVLIVHVRIRSNDSGGKGRRERRRATAGDKSCGGAARDSPEFTKTGAPGVVSTRAWVGCVQRVTRDAPGPKTGYGGALLAGHDCRGGSTRQGSPELECSGYWNSYGPYGLA